MHNLRILILCLGVVAAGCCSRKHSNSSILDVPVVSSETSHPVVPPLAFSQLSDGRLSVVGQTRHRVFSITDGLADVRTASQHPIVAAADQDGWFFFATSVVTDTTTHQPSQFISGYAIRHDGRQIVYWSTW
jgi:hypothetical protein